MTRSPACSTLPAPTADEALHSAAAARSIAAEISAAGGWISFERYMELALYTPGLGYYSAGAAKLGAEGDFVTAPEISDLFSRCVAHQCAEVLEATGGEIFELGAGTGRMAAVILQSLDDAGVSPGRYAILEVSADLRARQQARIAKLPERLRDRVVWLDRLPERGLRGVILANEVLDALPCRRFVRNEAGLSELGVALAPAGDSSGEAASDIPRFIEQEARADETLQAGISRIERGLDVRLAPGYRSEICERVAPWIAALAAVLERGALLAFDYGLTRAHYYHPQRTAGTLRCFYRHRAHDDALLHPGIQDITAWVDFTRVAEAALDAGLEVAGFATQAAFLLGNGIERFAADAASEVDRVRLAGEARRLLLPGEMGESFKAMALTRGFDAALGGFALQDLRASL